MRFGASAAAVLLFGLAARISLTAQAGPTLEPVLSFNGDGRLGPGLRPSKINCDEIVAERRTRALAGERLPGIEPGVRPTCSAVLGPAAMAGDAVAISALAGMLGGALGQPVVDRTGLKGLFDIDFTAAPPKGPLNGPQDRLPTTDYRLPTTD
jgi:uncharacterized protein (TIGR03435 family)